MNIFSRTKQRSATNDDRDNEQQQQEQRKQLDAVLQRRAKLAQDLESNSHQRAVLLSQWIKADETLADLERAGATSPNANRTLYGLQRCLAFLGYADRRAGLDLNLEGSHPSFPIAGREWTNRDTLPSLVEETDRVNRTIRGE